MVGALTLYQTNVGKKIVMAVTGLILFAFVFVHMYGNLHIFEGREAFNDYALFLRTVGMPFFAYSGALWVVRVIVGVSVVAHIWAAYQLTLVDLQSRPIRYGKKKYIAANYATRTMRWSGVIIALFVVYHILHFTTGTAYIEARFDPHDVYGNVVNGFLNPFVSLVYIIAQVALGLHLYHGVWSMSQSLGWKNGTNNYLWRGFATVTTILVAGGNILIPLVVLAGIVR
ncbi:MAG: succinate dehydrogenase cytochrome b subunit [Chloroflexi bacterium]|nr:succinate dehydrogenase cytochrome b subunit [Chloroflexota bacterium]